MQTPVVADAVPRYYQLFLQEDLLGGWSLVREWGHQGVAGRVVRDFFPCREEAMTALIKVRDAQLRRGYQVMFLQGEEARP